MSWGWVVCAGLYVDDVDAAFRQILLAHLMWVLLAGTAASVLMALIVRSIRNSLGADPAHAADIANLIADGDLSVVQNMATGKPGSLLYAMHQLEKQAATDALTGLSNRLCLEREIARAYHTQDAEAGQAALLLIDLDGFKQVNDTYGHAVGDALLKLFASALQARMRRGDTLARLGGDEFVILARDVSGKAGAQALADSVLVMLDNIQTIDGHSVAVSASIGICLLPARAGNTWPAAAGRRCHVSRQNKRKKAGGIRLRRQLRVGCGTTKVPRSNLHGLARLWRVATLRGARALRIQAARHHGFGGRLPQAAPTSFGSGSSICAHCS
jgi:diguanylate cyclase (GGDEF)-like protein